MVGVWCCVYWGALIGLVSVYEGVCSLYGVVLLVCGWVPGSGWWFWGCLGVREGWIWVG